MDPVSVTPFVLPNTLLRSWAPQELSGSKTRLKMQLPIWENPSIRVLAYLMGGNDDRFITHCSNAKVMCDF